MIDGQRLEPHSHACLSIPITTLEDGAYSLPILMLYAAFQMLIEFVRSGGLEETDWAQSTETEHAKNEIVELHKWWTKERPSRRSPLEDTSITDMARDFDLRMLSLLEEDAKLAMQWDDEDQLNLMRLINIRQYL